MFGKEIKPFSKNRSLSTPGSDFWVCEWNPKVWPFEWKLLSSTFLWYCVLRCTRWFWLLSLWIKSLSVTIHMKPTEQYFPVVLFITLYKLILTFVSVDEICKCDHLNESYWAILSCDAVYYALRGSSNFWVCGWDLYMWPFKWKIPWSTFLWCCLPYWRIGDHNLLSRLR